LYDQGTTRFDATDIDTVGIAVANLLSLPDKFENQRVFISGMAVNQVEILEALKKATKPDEWTVEYGKASELRAAGYEQLNKGDMYGLLPIIGASLFEEGHGQLHSATKPLVNKDLGVKDDLDATVEKYIKSLSK
jgi:hypothetical protein